MLIYEDYMQLFICQSCVEAGVCAAFGRVAGWLVSFPIRAEHPIGLRPDMPRIRRKCLIWLSILTLRVLEFLQRRRTGLPTLVELLRPVSPDLACDRFYLSLVFRAELDFNKSPAFEFVLAVVVVALRDFAGAMCRLLAEIGHHLTDLRR
jgi:hypothetical protein